MILCRTKALWELSLQAPGAAWIHSNVFRASVRYQAESMFWRNFRKQNSHCCPWPPGVPWCSLSSRGSRRPQVDIDNQELSNSDRGWEEHKNRIKNIASDAEVVGYQESGGQEAHLSWGLTDEKESALQRSQRRAFQAKGPATAKSRGLQ